MGFNSGFKGLIFCKHRLKIRQQYSCCWAQVIYSCGCKINSSDASFVPRGNKFRKLDQKWLEDNKPTGGHANIWNLAKRITLLALNQNALLCTAFCINGLVCRVFCRSRSCQRYWLTEYFEVICNEGYMWCGVMTDCTVCCKISWTEPS